MCIESQIIKDIDDSVIGPFGAHSYDGSLLRLFGFYALCQEAEESAAHARFRFALRRFSIEFWETALHGFFSVVVKDIDEYKSETKEMVFSRFVTCLRSVLIHWSKLNFSDQHIDDCVSLLGTLVGLEARRLKEIDSALIPFSQL